MSYISIDRTLGMSDQSLEQRVGAVRRFNRIYTRRIGVLQENFLNSSFSLAEGRVLYELARRERSTATELAADLGLDQGYLSRILRGFGERGLVVKSPSLHDRRQSLLSLTAKGRTAFARIDQRSQSEITGMVGKLARSDQERLVGAMHAIESVLGETPAPEVPYILRPPRAGDFGWIVSRHGALYGQEYGWDERLEALTAEIVAAFVRNYDRKRERCWIAERDGENVGSVLLVKETDEVARLRLLLVEPKARGLGIGARLVAETLRFAREARYRSMTLWTHSVLAAARHVYERAGFKLVATKEHDEFGKTLVGETWELELGQQQRQ
jgi:DNA-binding MarR family transcriptional regulator/GNAT superfamily N-acetyltransferase